MDSLEFLEPFMAARQTITNDSFGSFEHDVKIYEESADHQLPPSTTPMTQENLNERNETQNTNTHDIESSSRSKTASISHSRTNPRPDLTNISQRLDDVANNFQNRIHHNGFLSHLGEILNNVPQHKVNSKEK